MPIDKDIAGFDQALDRGPGLTLQLAADEQVEPHRLTLGRIGKHVSFHCNRILPPIHGVPALMCQLLTKSADRIPAVAKIKAHPFRARLPKKLCGKTGNYQMDDSILPARLMSTSTTAIS